MAKDKETVYQIELKKGDVVFIDGVPFEFKSTDQKIVLRGNYLGKPESAPTTPAKPTL
jgi:hypothetical protein